MATLGHMTNKKCHISISTRPVATNLHRMVDSNNNLQTAKLQEVK